MKWLFVIFGIVTASSSLASNLTIPNTFVGGTPAVAAEVNANFTAVEVAVDDNNSAIAEKVDLSGATMTGALTAPDFIYDAAKTRYYVVGINDFLPRSTSYTVVREDDKLLAGTAGDVFFLAPVHLPDGATITAVDFFAEDQSITSHVEWTMQEHNLSNGLGNFLIASVSGDDAANPGDENLAASGLVHIVDNSQYYYQMRLLFTDGLTTLGFYSARITYQVDKPE